MVDYGDIAAGTLGYIHNGVPGIVKAVKAYRTYKYVKRHGLDKKSFPNLGLQLKEEMAPIHRTPNRVAKKRKASMDLFTPSTFRSRRSSTASSSVSRRPSKVRMAVTPKVTSGVLRQRNEGSSGLRAAKVVNRKKKGVTIKKPKKVTVSRKFVQKVEKALKPKTINGRYLEIGNQAYIFPATSGNKQMVFQVGNASNSVFGLFNPARVLDSASVLFNTKTPTELSKWSNSGATTNFGAQSLDPRITKITVNNSYSSFVFRNNTNRTWIMQLYEMSPKQKMNYFTDGSAVSQWGLALQNDAETGGAGLPDAYDVNIAKCTPQTLYQTPNSVKAFAAKWKIERHDIILDPGQTYDHFVQGPSNVTYDYEKFWKPTGPTGASTEFQDLQPKFTREILLVCRLDLTEDVNKVPARQGIEDLTATPAVYHGRMLVEYKHYFNLQCPEQVAGVSSATNVVETNTGRRDCYFHKHWNEQVLPENYRIEVNSGAPN